VNSSSFELERKVCSAILHQTILDLLHSLCLGPWYILVLPCLSLKHHIRFMEFTALRYFQSELVSQKPRSQPVFGVHVTVTGHITSQLFGEGVGTIHTEHAHSS